MALPRLEGVIRLAASTQICTANTGGGAVAVNVAAGNYFIGSSDGATSSFLDALGDAIDAALGSGTTTITVDAGSDSSDQRVTISRGGTFSITWSNTHIRDALGFDFNLSSASSYESDNACRYLWLPTCGRDGESMLGAESSSTSRYGRPETDFSISMSPSGYSKRQSFSVRYRDVLSFRHVTGSSALIEYEVVGGESFEQFYEDTIGIGRLIRYYPDRSNLTVYQDWAVENGGELPCTPFDTRWRGPKSLWTCGPMSVLKRVGE